MRRIWSFAFCPLVFAVGLYAGQAPHKPLADGLFLQGVDGRLGHDDVNDIWVLDLTADVNVPGVQIPVGTEFPLLASATLENMIGDANDRALPLFRISVLVTRYEGKNYLLPMYYLPLSRLMEPNEPQQIPSGRPAVTGIEPNSVLPIPAEIAEMLKNRRPLRGPQRLTPRGSSQMAPARLLVDVAGFIERRQDHAVFIPDALGLSVSTAEYLLLPCATLEQAQQLQAASPNRVRFSIAGPLSEFKGKPYLLLQRASRVYNLGDFNG